MLQIGFKSHRGMQREHNEDACFIIPEKNVYIVADGVGGNAGGEVASRTAVYEITQFVNRYDLSDEAEPAEVTGYFRRCINKANLAIYNMCSVEDDNKRMATTVVICAIRGNCAYFAHAGDSRAYILRKGALTQITEDHTYVNALLKAGIITEEEALNHDERHMITKALGAEKDVEPEFKMVEIKKDDIILLCTDGLFGEIDESTITQILSDKTLSMSEVSRILVDEANKSGGADNITVVCLRI